MKIHELTISSPTRRKRVGRGIGSGTGKTAGRGTKGQNSRSGGGVRPGFEGGQNPLAKRLPKKRGFRPHRQIMYTTVTLSQLNGLKAGKVTNDTLVAARLAPELHTPIKALGTGELTKKLNVELQAATKAAITAITKAGGSFQKADVVRTPKKPSKRNRNA